MEDFQVVARKKTKKAKNMENKQIVLKKKLSDIRFEMMSLPFFAETLAVVRAAVKTCGQTAAEAGEIELPVHLVCYGLGTFAESYIARYQLVFLLALRDELKVPDEHCDVFDPQFSEEEITLLKHFNCNVLEHNQEGKHACRPGMKTIFFMPHCGKALYNNVLWANWGPDLKHLTVIGNSFSHMIESTPERILKRTAIYILKIKDLTTEVPIPELPDNDAVFNDTSVHSFLQAENQEALTSLWEDNEEPVYDESEAEIIFR